jgi:hypothetical protein
MAHASPEKPVVPVSTREARATANLSNTVLNLYFTERNSELWHYMYAPGTWGESCWHEHFAVYTSTTGTVESEDFAVAVPFSNPGGGAGSVSAVLTSGDVEVRRRITLPPGDSRYFQMIYTIRNAGSNALADVRFFETIDFDVPRTGDHSDDFARYVEETDFIYIWDEGTFQNGIASSVRSSRHGIADYWTELFSDWDDGELNNQNEYGPGDPGIGKQFNLGSLGVGQSRNITLTIWFGEPSEEEQASITGTAYVASNATAHHTAPYPDTVFRRAQEFKLQVGIGGAYDEGRNAFGFVLTLPNGQQRRISKKSASTQPGDWYFVEGAIRETPGLSGLLGSAKYKTFQLYIGDKAQVGRYGLLVELDSYDGNASTVLDTRAASPFCVIFNPWHDGDVWSPSVSLTAKQVERYGTSNEAYMYPYFNEQSCTLNYMDNTLFSFAMDLVSGKTDAAQACLALQQKSHSMIWGNWSDDVGDGVAPWDWSTDVSAIVRKWQENGESPVKYGQCFTFGMLLTSLLRSVGIPNRPVTAMDSAHDWNGNNIIGYVTWFGLGSVSRYSDPEHEGTQLERWGFHVWNEAYLPSLNAEDGWAVTDATYDLAQLVPRPTIRSTPSDGAGSARFVWEEVNLPVGTASGDPTVQHVETYNPDVNAGINVVDAYRSGGTPSTRSETASGVTISILSDRNVALGQGIVLHESVTNTTSVPLQLQVTLEVTGLPDAATGGAGDGAVPPGRKVVTETATVALDAGGTWTQERVVTLAEYVRGGAYVATILARASDGESVVAETSAYVAGLPISLACPATLEVGETATLDLTVHNPLGTTVRQVECHLSVPVGLAVTGDVETTIGELAPGGDRTLSVQVTAQRSGSYSILGATNSPDAGSSTKMVSVRVRTDAAIDVMLDMPAQVAAGSEFDLLCRIANTGDRPALGVQIELLLPAVLATGDSLVRGLGDIGANSEVSTSWRVRTSEAGTFSIEVQVGYTRGAGDRAAGLSDSAVLTVVGVGHEIGIVAVPETLVLGTDLAETVLTITSNCNTSDTVFIETHGSSPEIAYSIYDGEIPIISGPVTIPPNSSQELRMVVTLRGPQPGISAGRAGESDRTITVHATSALDPTAAAAVTVRIAEESTCLAAGQQVGPAGWHMISIPGQLCDPCMWMSGECGDLLCALDDDLDPFFAYRYDPNVGTYVRVPPADQICYQPGMGIWTYTWEPNTQLDADVTTLAGNVEIPLQNGWNQVGNPYTFPIGTGSIRVRCDAQELSLLDAQAQGWISAALYGYDTAARAYTEIDPATGCLPVWTGCWIQTLRDDCTLVFQPVGCSASASQARPLSAAEVSALRLPPPPPFDPRVLDIKGILAGLSARNVPNPVRSEHTTVFRVEGLTADLVGEMRVEIYDQNGARVFTQRIAAKELTWHTVNDAGELLANGVYLYQVWVRIGEIWYPMEIQKLAVVR